MQSLCGQLLIAAPNLTDPNFYRTVVLIIEHNPDGAFGVVLNRLTTRTVEDLWSKLSQQPCENQQTLNLGGPVPGPLMAVHTQETHSDIEVLPGVYFSMHKQDLDEIVRTQETPLRVFIGHAGWGGGQLEGEIRSGDWLTTPASYDYIFHHEEDLWKRVTADMASAAVGPALKVKHFPQDPSLN